MMAVSIYDTLYFTANSEGRLKVLCKWASGTEASALGADPSSPLGDLPQDEENIVWRAVEHFRRSAGVKSGATIRLVKRIPAASGLGGASSDAAATLVAANLVWKVGWTRQRLAMLAADLGSDVPFFVGGGSHGSQMAICRGRGERLVTLPGMTKLHFVIVRPPLGLSTAAVYAACRPADRPVDAAPLVGALQSGGVPALRHLLLNRLETAAQQLSPWIGRLRSEFEKFDLLGHQMTGSGTGYFGICRHARQARRVAGLLRAARVGRVFHARGTSPSCRVTAVPARGCNKT